MQSTDKQKLNSHSDAQASTKEIWLAFKKDFDYERHAAELVCQYSILVYIQALSSLIEPEICSFDELELYYPDLFTPELILECLRFLLEVRDNLNQTVTTIATGETHSIFDKPTLNRLCLCGHILAIALTGRYTIEFERLEENVRWSANGLTMSGEAIKE